MNAQNRSVIGYDMFSEPTRRAAMIQARDTGQAALTRKLTLVEENGNRDNTGVLIYVPVYKSDLDLITVEQRRHALAGWEYGAFRVTELLEGIHEDWATPAGVRRAIGVRIYDQQAHPDNLLFSNLPETTQSDQGLRSEEHTSELQSRPHLVCRLLLEKKKKK